MRDIALFVEYDTHRKIARARAKRLSVAGMSAKRHEPGVNAMKNRDLHTANPLALFRRSRERACAAVERPHYSSSFPRKRESRPPLEGLTGVFSCGNAAIDSRFRACEKIEASNYISSFPRKRESRPPARKTLRQFSCRDTRLDSRFRGNDEMLSVDYCLICAESGVPRSLLARVSRFFHTLFRGNDEVLLADYCLYTVPNLRCPGRRVQKSLDFFTHSFAGMTKTGAVSRFLHTLFRRNDGEWRHRPVSLRTRRAPLKTR